MGYEKPRNKWPWRDFLTHEEAQRIKLADDAKATWERLSSERAMIQNRAIQRAKYHDSKERSDADT